jgi:hypothetical protein
MRSNSPVRAQGDRSLDSWVEITQRLQSTSAAAPTTTASRDVATAVVEPNAERAPLSFVEEPVGDDDELVPEPVPAGAVPEADAPDAELATVWPNADVDTCETPTTELELG